MLRNHNRHWGNFFADDEDVFPEDEKRIDFYSGIIIIPVCPSDPFLRAHML